MTKAIASIAGQTNLLALNATIEAARAGGRAGLRGGGQRGQDLARLTLRSSEEIDLKLSAIQADTGAAVEAIGQITAIIDQLNELATNVAGAVEEQAITSNDIGRSLTEAATGSADIARNIMGVADAASSTSQGPRPPSSRRRNSPACPASYSADPALHPGPDHFARLVNADDELLEAFLEESTENLDQFDLDLVEFEAHPDDPEPLTRVFRTCIRSKAPAAFWGYPIWKGSPTPAKTCWPPSAPATSRCRPTSSPPCWHLEIASDRCSTGWRNTTTRAATTTRTWWLAFEHRCGRQAQRSRSQRRSRCRFQRPRQRPAGRGATAGQRRSAHPATTGVHDCPG